MISRSKCRPSNIPSKPLRLLITGHQIDWIATLTNPMNLFAPEPDPVQRQDVRGDTRMVSREGTRFFFAGGTFACGNTLSLVFKHMLSHYFIWQHIIFLPLGTIAHLTYTEECHAPSHAISRRRVRGCVHECVRRRRLAH
ncbi:hypothetical protein, partial [uncultured Caballeronia sp.]|uniref:hypothetical protein n=1 Tax=uncultured Caballeronia sp. TaxID=1827198 RepID=UPI0035CB7041